MSWLDKIKEKFGFKKSEGNEISSQVPTENKFEKWEDYLYPNTNILKNKFNLVDFDLLTLAENWHTATIQAELNTKPIKGNFDLEHFKEIHKQYFEKVYEWAGQIRNVKMGKLDDTGKEIQWFCPPEEIDARLKTVFDNLKNENYLKGLDPNAFSIRAGYYLGKINNIHPFREGNWRTQRTFIGQIAKEAGYKIDWKSITPEQMLLASIESHKGNSINLAQIIQNSISTILPAQKHEKTKATQDSKYKDLFEHYSKEVLDETGQVWTGKTNQLIAEKMIKNNISLQRVKTAMKYSPEPIEKINNFIKEIENKPEIKNILAKDRGRSR